MTEDYYTILEVTPSASGREIKDAYKRLALRWHPDKNPSSRSEAELRFRQLSEAYQVLSDPSRRAAYDASRNKPRGVSLDFDWSAFSDPFFVYQEVFGGTSDGAVQVTASVFSEATTVDELGNKTVVRTTIENGVKMVTVFRNGEQVEQTTTVLKQLARR